MAFIGHSWVIDKYNDWNKFEKVLSYVSNSKNLRYLTNFEII
ncbi:hypothetical protein ES703_60416 [subsurface metagenome]